MVCELRLTLPWGWTTFKPICLSTVSKGWSTRVSSLEERNLGWDNIVKDDAYSGNSPATLAIYSFLTFPWTNSSPISLASFNVRGKISNPDVSRSSRLTATFFSFMATGSKKMSYYEYGQCQIVLLTCVPQSVYNIWQQHELADKVGLWIIHHR